MPNGGLNIYFSARDGMSPTLSAITDKTRALDKETQELDESYQALKKANASLIEQKTKLTKSLSEARDQAKEAKKSFEKLGDEVSRNNYEQAQQKVEEYRNEILRLYGQRRDHQHPGEPGADAGGGHGDHHRGELRA